MEKKTQNNMNQNIIKLRKCQSLFVPYMFYLFTNSLSNNYNELK